MMDESFQGIKDKSPFIAWIHNISLNQQKYMRLKLQGLDLGHDVRYIIFIYDHPNCSQDDLVNMFCQSKGNIAKILKRFEDEGYITRKTNPENRRKYMLKTTDKADELVPRVRKMSLDWEKEVGIDELDVELRRKIMEIAIKGMELAEEKSS